MIVRVLYLWMFEAGGRDVRGDFTVNRKPRELYVPNAHGDRRCCKIMNILSGFEFEKSASLLSQTKQITG